jgi:intracellular multiplication protein IcmN
MFLSREFFGSWTGRYFGKWTFRQIGQWTCLCFALLCMAGCHHRSDYFANFVEPKALPTRVAFTHDHSAMRLLKRLNNHGVTVITMGQDYLISIPASLVFADQSPRIRWEGYALLNEVVCYLKEFRKISVDISTFSSKYVSPSRERALTAARSRVLADYFWTQDIDTRFVFTRGLGSDKPIAFNTNGGDTSLNSRIEITFRNAIE